MTGNMQKFKLSLMVTVVSLLVNLSSVHAENNFGGGSATKLSCSESQFVRLLNMYRKSYGLNSLEVSIRGVRGARWHGQDMMTKNYFSHTEPNGRRFNDRADSFGYPSHGENIAAGNVLATKTFCQLKLSPGHNRNMLNTRHETMGIGHISGGGKYKNYWVNTFGPRVDDIIHEPLAGDSACALPQALPKCVKN